jgi:hypothetical protein
MATPPTTDPADEAGGEVVFASDGLAPTPLTKPPEMTNTSRELVQGEDVVDSETSSPQRAFEVFQGKVYSNTTTANSHTPVILAKETPLARLARLQQEIQEVEAQLSTTAAASGQDFDQELVTLATTLKTQLTTLSSSNRIMEHDDLTRLIRQQLASLQEAPSSSSSGDAANKDSTGIVYELYGNATNPTTTLEDRLVRLERAVGSTKTQKTLLQRLEEMERLVKTVDAATLDQTATKAKVLRADLEAASKARNKLTATYKKEDSKMIQQLHSQLVELEGLSDYLPALVERLQQLASLHVQAGTFSTRLEALEVSSNQLGHSVSQAEGTMEQLAKNLTENLTTMEGNLKVLDERLKNL